MVDVAWLTDPHLNFLRAPGAQEEFGRYVDNDLQEFENPIVVITGDIAECPSFGPFLYAFARGLNEKRKIPVYYVLGNHDAYGSSIEKMKENARSTNNFAKKEGVPLLWLTEAGVIELTKEIALVGHDGWYDAHFGDALRSGVDMADFYLIEDFSYLDKSGERQKMHHLAIIEKARYLGERSAIEAEPALVAAAKKYKHVIFATHVPPFKEACIHQGQVSDPNWLPWFSNRALGLRLVEIAYEYPDTFFEVLCGHTHSPGLVTILPNLVVRTGGAKYGVPDVFKVLNY